MKLFHKGSKQKKETRSLPMGKKSRSAFAVYAALVLMLCCCTTTAFAASDPLTVINNLSDFIFGLIRAVGMILLGFGVVQIDRHATVRPSGLKQIRNQLRGNRLARTCFAVLTRITIIRHDDCDFT